MITDGPGFRRHVLRKLATQDRWTCYAVIRHRPDCWAHRGPVKLCDGRLIRSPYYGDEHWKIRYWRKAITG